MQKNSVLAIALLTGTIVGAGIFSLPYVVSRVGLVRGIFYFLFFASVYYGIHRMYADLLLKTEESHQFVYVARAYLPRLIANIVSSGVFLELLFIMTIYMILAPSFLKFILELSPAYLIGIFWFLGSLFMLARLAWIGWAEVLGVGSILLAIGAILWMDVMSVGKPIDWGTMFGGTLPGGWANMLMPLGPLLFALSGRPAIGEVVKIWRKSKRENHPFLIHKAIFWGTMIPVALYLAFVLGVLTLTPHPSFDAISGLGFLSPLALLTLGILGFIALWTSYFMIGINVRDTLREDLKTSKVFAYVVPWFIPPLLYIVGVNNFLGVVSFTGSVLLGMEGIAIAFMWRRAFLTHPHRWIATPLMAIFSIAIISEIIKFL